MTGTRASHPVIPAEQVDYSPLVGFVPPAERIDPHVHVVQTPAGPNLRELVEVVRHRERNPTVEKLAATVVR